MENKNTFNSETAKANFKKSNENWTPVAKICAHCGKSYIPKDFAHQSPRYRFCSKECQRKYHSIQKRKNTNGFDRVCVICGKEFHTNNVNAKTCSKDCSKELAYKTRHPNIHTVDLVKTCKHCGKEFHTNNHQKKYCSPECKKAYYEEHGLKEFSFKNWVKRESTTKKCEFCGKEFTTTKPNRRFCSESCRKKCRNKLKSKGQIVKVCVVCGKEFLTNQPKAKYCSTQCKISYYESHGLNIYAIKGHKLKEKIKKSCPICGKEFETAINKIYCSRYCKRIAEKQKYAREHNTVTYTKTCPVCGKEFQTTNKLKLYCSKDCYNNGPHSVKHYVKKEPPKPRTCKICGKEFTPDNTHPNSFLCSKDCRRKWASQLRKQKIIAEHGEVNLNKKCAFCGKDFVADKLHPHQKCCSPSCTRRYRKYNGLTLEEVNKKREEHKAEKLFIAPKLRICKHCGKEFTATSCGHRYCSDECKKLHTKKEKVVYTKTCKICGKEFQTNNKKAVCCSKECSYRNRSYWSSKNCIGHNYGETGKTYTGVCQYCGKKFEYIFNGHIRKYCSKTCAKKRERRDYSLRHRHEQAKLVTYKKTCQNPDCGKEFEYSAYYYYDKKYCSDECRKHHNHILSEKKKIDREEFRNKLREEIKRIKNLSTEERKIALSTIKEKLLNRKRIENLEKENSFLDEKEYSHTEEVIDHLKMINDKKIQIEKKRLPREIERELKIQKKLDIEDAKKERALRKAERVAYWNDHPEEYQAFLLEKKENQRIAREASAARKRKAAKKKQRNALKHRIQRARKLGLKIEYAVCEECGSKFAYIAESYKTDKRGNITVRGKLNENDIPRFCCESCRDHYRWTHGGKEKAYKCMEERKSGYKVKKQENLVSHWRGSGNFYSSQYMKMIESSKTTIDNMDEMVYNTDIVDLSEQFNVFDTIDQY